MKKHNPAKAMKRPALTIADRVAILQAALAKTKTKRWKMACSQQIRNVQLGISQ